MNKSNIKTTEEHCFGELYNPEDSAWFEGGCCKGISCPNFEACEARLFVMKAATPVNWDALEHHCIARGLC